ncbi:nucleoside ABC transporter membrane protein [Clostridium cavendishii DSM 21758]|uniref:Nucleoside ABC transporter membrane protein n=1 Tax=Clostridium cavendishii DSM 21758 TaxID=1121302 RepID=A0A1M6MLA4_9CLOT|nr:ABC transporter permease [Clostridium cavendishii]SHJ84239.1 nucleoside ABC transporter membrane protein [Clostridium cavendishii DSM 21758]
MRIVKREDVSKRETVIVKVLSIVLALIVAGVFLKVLDYDPMTVFMGMIKGAFGSKGKITQTIIYAIPLIITAIGISIAFKMQFWNIGGDGQILMGAFGAALVALNMGSMPKVVLLILMAIVAMICAGIWAFIAAVLKTKFNTNETIITLMLNYIALKFITFLQYDLWRDKAAMGFPKIANFPKNAVLPQLFGVHIGWIIALVLIGVFYIIMKHSKLGYEISVLGESENTAKYAGINIKKTIIKAIFISGALCGLTGFIQASAVSGTLSIEVTGGVGYTAIIVAWLSNLNSIIIGLVSILFAGLTQGGSYIQTAYGVPNSAALVIQALILFSVLGSEFFTKYKLLFRDKNVIKEKDIERVVEKEIVTGGER